MKIVERIDVIQRGAAQKSLIWKTATRDVESAIQATDWPHGTGLFRLNPGLEAHANGVLPIKTPCIDYLRQHGWRIEHLPEMLGGVKMGNLDALKESRSGKVGFEWETGNISSSHRAINKIFHAMLRGGLLGGILVVPSERMRRYFTDRIGNITELREYFPVWQAIAFDRGAFRIYVVEYDELSKAVAIIPKGKDGMARK